MKKAIITGITGQDGSYLAELLIEKGYEVHGIIRKSSSINTWRIHDLFYNKNIYNKTLFLHYGDMTDFTSISEVVKKVKPDEFYNLAAQSHVKVSFEIPIVTAEIDALGTLKVLEAIRILGMEKDIRFYQASTSELYGKVVETPQTETTPFYPRSPYAAAKLYGFWIIKNYREAYNLFACNGILFNHESERRGITFVTRKITLGLARIKLDQIDCIELGNLNSKRDWGYAPEYAEGMWMMLQSDKPDDYVMATGETHSIREFAELAADELGYNIKWEGEGVDEKGVDKKTGEVIFKVNPRYFRPTEVDLLIGDPSKANNELGWKAETKLKVLVKIMAEADLKRLKSGQIVY